MSFADTAVLFVLALLLFGPKKLPVIARQIGKALNEFKRASNEFKAQIESEINQLDIQERQKKYEERQKILPPAQPPSGAVESSRTFSAGKTTEECAPVSQSSVETDATNATNA